jgi:hypothetical protein
MQLIPSVPFAGVGTTGSKQAAAPQQQTVFSDGQRSQQLHCT